MRGLMRGLVRFAFGAALGAALGLAIGTLYAPESGEQLKRRFRDRLAATRTAGDQAERDKVEQLRREFKQHIARRDS